MDDEQQRTLADVWGFLDGTLALKFAVAASERYAFIGTIDSVLRNASPVVA